MKPKNYQRTSSEYRKYNISKQLNPVKMTLSMSAYMTKNRQNFC